MPLSKRALAEFFGTFWLVFGGCGSAVLAAAFPSLGIGFVGVSLAFGLTVLTMAFAIGHVSGCHLNPAVSIGLVAGKRFPVSELIPYIVAQVLGAIAASGVLYIIASGKPGFSLAGGRGRPHRLLPSRYPRFHRRARTQRLRPHRHRPLPHADSPH
jgi:aquaporin Z